MYGLLIEKMKSGYFTNLKEVLDVLGNNVKNYNWLLSYYDCSIYPSEKIPFAELFVWLSGNELANILEEHEIPFIWGVLTSYEKGISLNEVMQYPLPYADGYEGFWKPEVTMQNPLAEIEIVPWDSSVLLIISKSKGIICKFAEEYPDSIDLAKNNEKH